MLGAGLALTIVECVVDVPDLESAWPTAIVSLVLLNRLFFRRREPRLLAELAARQAGSSAGPR